MVKPYFLKFQQFPFIRRSVLLFMLLFYCPLSMAAQEAIVIVDKAYIYSDQEMTSAIGYVSRGKKVAVGEIPRNKAQVYPIIVSGKIAYIRVLDVSTEKEGVKATRLSTERFYKNANPPPKTKYVLSYFTFNSQISQDKKNSRIEDGDPLLWHGLGLKGEVLVKERWDIQLLLNYMGTSEEQETYRVLEFGAGGALRLITHRKFLARLDVQLLGVPFATYAVSDDFRIKSFGYTAGSNLSLTFLFTEHFGIEAYGGFYHTQLTGFDLPEPYQDFSPSFSGSRFGAGLNLTY